MFKRATYTEAVHPLRIGITWNWHYSGNGKESASNEFDFDVEDEIDL